MSEKYLRAYNNDSFFDFDRNGERLVIQRFADWFGSKPCTVWDVGANKGQWALTFHENMPTAEIISFEILPPIADILRERALGRLWWRIENTGMSDRDGTIIVTWNRNYDTTSAVVPADDNPWFAHQNVDQVECRTTTLDTFSGQVGITPDLLKIDTEGHDAAVLDGGAMLLAGRDAPALIQFEYGHTWIPAARMLGPVHRQLEKFGYSVGRVYPDYVDFKQFETVDENFRMGNIVAAKDRELIDLLADR